ncbi:MAG: Glycogen phosphorylase [Cytophagales bacterium]|jgi:starch phosphorylase|nr:alpha-glucan family phosphorylase [Bacteroidota bacterium]MBS1979669.1 alpha-glucan family phosphorylase [Bacteroidota bacterium]WHZ06922.1 MAG: Glycogen phosphorylase [Cytophagales bacterium]
MAQLFNLFPYKFDKKYSKPVAYFSMEFAIEQPLKIYSGGLGFLAGSHMRSAYELKQNMIGIGILWKYGYYDQKPNKDGTLAVDYVQKDYSFLTDTGILFTISIHNHPVHVKVWLLKPEVFQSAPVFLLSTDVAENDYLAQTICHRLYDSHESARIAQSILLGVGGAKLMDELERETEVYHMNEGHALPLCFYLLKKYNDLNEVKKRVVFTTHTPEKAGNEEHSVRTLEVLGFFQEADEKTMHKITAPDEHTLNYTLAALRMARKANGVSQLHGKVSQKMWKEFDGICEITAITNAQNHKYWADQDLKKAIDSDHDKMLQKRKKELKQKLFSIVANQTGKLLDPNVLTIVWARRFAAYKRANLLLSDFARFEKMVTNKEYPVQVIWAGKPYPEDDGAIAIFNDIYWKTKSLPSCAILTGYELWLSGYLKRGSDVWLNNPRLYHEASGTSGMTAAMNGSVNVSIPDGWVPEFARHGKNCFIIQTANDQLPVDERDRIEANNLYDLLEKEVIPTYYKSPAKWVKLVKTAAKEVVPQFDSGRMADEYYEKMYSD